LAAENLKEAWFYERVGDVIECRVCPRLCRIPEGAVGFCQTRVAVGGKLFSLAYGRVAAMHISPSEIKPFFHYLPGALWLSVGTLGCNFRCPGCQNYHLAHSGKDDFDSVELVSPEELVRIAKERKTSGLSFTYNEPTVWLEYTVDCAKLAKEKGLLVTCVTNGFISKEALSLLLAYLDAARIDVKGFSGKTYKKIANTENFRAVLDTAETMKTAGKHIEIVTNLTPGYNDDENELKELANWVRASLGENTPWHITRFYPYLKLSRISATPLESLLRAREIGLSAGLRFVYLGNVPGHEAENTFCPKCGEKVIERYGCALVKTNLIGSRCAFCSEDISIRWN
jgi:pyruvate formate lyase activating enzyme